MTLSNAMPAARAAYGIHGERTVATLKQRAIGFMPDGNEPPGLARHLHFKTNEPWGLAPHLRFKTNEPWGLAPWFPAIAGRRPQLCINFCR